MSVLINAQYGQTDLSARILEALEKAGKNIHALERDDLRTFDEFHPGGRFETRRLAGMIGLLPGQRVLDVGSGLGGPARTLAAEFGCVVTGIDLTATYCHAARMLTERVGLAERVTFQRGDALELPFADRCFDVVWAQFMSMNIEDKARFYRELYRVGGALALHEAVAGSRADLHYPVFWADEKRLNFLQPPDAIRELLKTIGFVEMAWVDRTPETIEWFRRTSHLRPETALGLDIFITGSAAHKAANLVRNMEADRVRVIQSVWRAD